MGRSTFVLHHSAVRKIHLALVALCSFMLMQATHAGGISPASSCNPLAQDTCGLPFPSDVFRNTVGRYNFSDSILDKRTSGSVRTLLPARAQFPSTFHPSQVFNNSTGFSALGPILFELNEWPFHDIPKDGEGHLHVYNRSTGERVPMVVSLSTAAQPQRDFREPRPVIIAWPRSRLEFGEKYIAVLFKEPFNAAPEVNGQEIFAATEGVQKALAGQAGWVLNYVYNPVLSDMDGLGIARDNVLSFTWFTVRKESEVVDPMRKMIQIALQRPNYIRDLEVTDSIGDPDYGLVTLKGLMSITNFRSTDGGVYPPYEYIADPSRSRAEFLLTLPKWEGSAPVPVSVWGHGLGNTKELTRSGYIMGDRLGMATLAIDHPNHGSRVTVYDSFKEPHISTAISSPLSIMHLLGMFVQGTVDHNVAIYNARYQLNNAVSHWEHEDYPNLPAIDGNRVMFDGMSLGGMLGVAIGATAPELEGAYLVNGAASLMQVFSESTFWDDLTSNVIPQNMNGAELAFVLAMMQHYVDIGDGNNFAHFFRNPPEGQAPRPLGMHYSLGDGSLINDSSRATAEIVDLPLLKEVIEPEPNLRYGTEGIENFEQGYGIVQSGFGYAFADQSMETLRELDLDNTLGLGDTSVLGDLLGVNLDALPANLSYTGYLQDMLGLEDANSLEDIIDVIYEGELDDFLTHFNRGSEAAVHRAIDWRCEVLVLDADRCSLAKQKASEDAERIANGELIPGGGDGNNDPLDEINDMIDQGLNNIEVTEGSAGSINGLMLMLLMLFALRPYAKTIRKD